MDTPTLIPLSQIDAQALPRDRAALDAAPLDTLRRSILAEGLRQPIEVFPIVPEAQGAPDWGLISGLRRLTCFRALAETFPQKFAEIPAFVRTPADIPAALAAMVSENENRAQVSPWEKARLVVEATDQRLFDTHDAALAALFPLASRTMTQRLRNFVEVVLAFEGLLSTPENLSQRQMERLSLALREGFEDLAEQILRGLAGKSLTTQWEALAPVLTEAAHPPELDVRRVQEPGRPRRVVKLKQGLVIRRERTRDGWALRFSGPEARSGGLVDDVMDQVERWFQRRE